MVEHDPDAGRPFSAPEHVLDLAEDYAGPEIGIREQMGRSGDDVFSAPSIVAADAGQAYAERAAGLVRTVAEAAERFRSAAEIMRDIEAAQRPDPTAGDPPPMRTTTGDPPPDPKPPSEPNATTKNVAEVEKRIAELDAQIKAREAAAEKPVLTDRLKEYDALVDEEAKVDRTLFDVAATCLTRTR